MVNERSIEPAATIGSLDDLAAFARERNIGGLIVHAEAVLLLPVMNVRSGDTLRRFRDICDIVYVTERSRTELGRRLGSDARMYASELGGLVAAVSKATRFLNIPRGELAFVSGAIGGEVLAADSRMLLGQPEEPLLHAYVPEGTNIFVPQKPEPVKADYALAGPGVELN